MRADPPPIMRIGPTDDPICTVHETVDFERLSDREWSQRAARLARRCLQTAEDQRARVNTLEERLAALEGDYQDILRVMLQLIPSDDPPEWPKI